MAVSPNRSVALSVVAAHTRPRRASGVGAATAIVLATGTSSLILPTGITVLLGVVGFAVMLAARANAERLRATLIARASRRARAARRRARERALISTTLGGREVLEELANLVDGIEASAPDVARRFELEELLDRHVALTLARERAIRAASMFDRGQLERTRDAFRSAPVGNERRLELCERRLRTHEHCHARANDLATELALLADLIRLVAQRVACPEEPPPDDRIERYLAELDEDDAAQKQLADDIA